MTEYYAHSADEEKGIPAQTYAEHIKNVYSQAAAHAQIVCEYAKNNGDALLQAVKSAACFHDLGKLYPENQRILSGEKKSKALKLPHWDAGAALLMLKNLAAAAAIYSHHSGYPDFAEESNRGEAAFRDKSVIEKTVACLKKLGERHRQAVSIDESAKCEFPAEKGEERSIFLRMVLSCLADADHEDTAVHYGNFHKANKIIPLKPQERLAKLDAYIAAKQSNDPRNLLRGEMYYACKNAQINGSIASCGSPVGSGKTTAVMAHLLNQAQERGLRRIFVVLPFTNIIRQSVEVYREALVLPGENPKDVVAELHHKADFENENTRHLTSLWRAPIIVTTAVAFFETLAARRPAALRRLHELPGSAIFVDEAHAALPAKLLPITWKWMNCYGNNWGCYWVLASGSLCRFWEINKISDGKPVSIPEITKDELRQRLATYENNRIVYKYDLTPKNATELANWVSQFCGPRLLILNTVQSAAVVAEQMNTCFGRKCVEHLSTALTAEDRDETLERVKKRLKNTNDNDWTLVATSCVEAGVDLSFRTGFREIGSLCSLLQAAGRVNREGKNLNAEMWSFCLADHFMLKTNPGMNDSARVLRRYFEKKKEIVPSLCTDAIKEELRLQGTTDPFQKLIAYESSQRFPCVEKNYRVITSDTCLAVVDSSIVEKIKLGAINWQEIQKHSVRIPKYKLEEAHIPKVLGEIYQWNLKYDTFLGYMAGIIMPKN